MLAVTTDEMCDLDSGPRQRGAVTERMCIVSRQVQPIEAMIRFVLGPAGEVMPDLTCKLPGRGAWVSGTRAAVETAVSRKLFGKSFRQSTPADPALPDLIDALLEAAALAQLSMAQKAGAVVTGAAKIEAVLREQAVRALLHATDAARDGVRKLDGLLRLHGTGADVLNLFSSAQMDLALGRTHVIHAVLMSGGVAESFVKRARRVVKYRMSDRSGEDVDAR